MRSRLRTDLDRWERGELSLSELGVRHPGTGTQEITALHTTLTSLRTEPTPAPSRDSRWLARLPGHRPGQARGIRARLQRPMALAAALSVLTAGLALGLEPVRETATALFRGAVRMVAPAGLSGLAAAPQPPVPVVLPIRIGVEEDRPMTWLPAIRNREGGSVSCVVVDAPRHGRATVHSDCSTGSYVPDPDYFGTDAFRYLARIGHGPAVAADVDVVVVPVNDPPLGVGDEAFTDEDIPVVIPALANDSDPDGDSRSPTRDDLHQAVSRNDLMIRATSGALGTVEVVGRGLMYTPAPNFYGVDVFRYTVWDGNDGFDSTSVKVRVAPVNDPPVVEELIASGPEDATITWSAPVEDVDGDVLSCSLLGAPQHGKATLSPDCSEGTYIPDPDHHGLETMRFVVTDGELSVEGTVTFDVEPVNDPPRAEGVSLTGDEDSPIAWTPAVEDVDGDALSCSILEPPEHGQASVSPDCSSGTYVPDPNFHGDDVFSYAVRDGAAKPETSARVAVSIRPVNDVPVAVTDTATTQEGVPVVVSPLANDIDVEAQPLAVHAVGAPSSGHVSLNADSTVTYTPHPGFVGVDSFSYAVSDPEGGSATGVVVVTVTPSPVSIASGADQPYRPAGEGEALSIGGEAGPSLLP